MRKVIGNTEDLTDRKLDPNWEGPYKITKPVRKGVYYLENHEGKQVLTDTCMKVRRQRAITFFIAN